MSKMISSTRPFCLCIPWFDLKHASYKYIVDSNLIVNKMGPKLNKMAYSCVSHLTLAMLLYCHANCASFIMAWLFACRILFICLCTLFMLALVCLVLLRIDAEQGIYQENQEHYPDPSLASTELPGKHYHMLAYIQYLLPLSYSCIIESRLH